MTPGKSRGSFAASRGTIIGGGAMVFFERDENVRVAGADQPGGGVLHVQRAVRQADVVEDVVHLRRWHDSGG